jgi:hypothetical protein
MSLGIRESIVQKRKTRKLAREVCKNNICVGVGITASVQEDSTESDREDLADSRLIEPPCSRITPANCRLEIVVFVSSTN